MKTRAPNVMIEKKKTAVRRRRDFSVCSWKASSPNLHRRPIIIIPNQNVQFGNGGRVCTDLSKSVDADVARVKLSEEAAEPVGDIPKRILPPVVVARFANAGVGLAEAAAAKALAA